MSEHYRCGCDCHAFAQLLLDAWLGHDWVLVQQLKNRHICAAAACVEAGDGERAEILQDIAIRMDSQVESHRATDSDAKADSWIDLLKHFATPHNLQPL